MGKQYNSKTKLKILNSQGVPAVLVNVIRIADTLLLDEIAGTDEEYAVVAMQVIRKLREEYRRDIAIEQIVPKQTDLCTLIEDLRTGKEPVFINKIKQQKDEV